MEPDQVVNGGMVGIGFEGARHAPKLGDGRPGPIKIVWRLRHNTAARYLSDSKNRKDLLFSGRPRHASWRPATGGRSNQKWAPPKRGQVVGGRYPFTGRVMVTESGPDGKLPPGDDIGRAQVVA
jgi:hypothetical protein